MGFFGQSRIEEAVYRQMDNIRDRVWGSPTDTEETLALKKSRIDDLENQILQVDDRKVRSARKRWIRDARRSLDFWRERALISAIKIPPLSSSLSGDSSLR